MVKYLWYCTELGVSDDFNTFRECENDAISQCSQYGCELSIYSYDAEEFPNGNMDIDDCNYIGYISLEN